MEWCVDRLPKDAASVFDPFMGSGTTGVACARRGRAFTGVEREPEFFEVALKRIREAERQDDLFSPAAAPDAPEQRDLEL
jgi:site-specific DNA-methyltransferase (adenine-specific)/modification methylase